VVGAAVVAHQGFGLARGNRGASRRVADGADRLLSELRKPSVTFGVIVWLAGGAAAKFIVEPEPITWLGVILPPTLYTLMWLTCSVVRRAAMYPS
jgi:hypothetical protein